MPIQTLEKSETLQIGNNLRYLEAAKIVNNLCKNNDLDV